MSWQSLVILLSVLALVLPSIGAIRAYRSGRAALVKARENVAISDELVAAWHDDTAAAQESDSDEDGETRNRRWHAEFEQRGLVVPSYETMNKEVGGYRAQVRILSLIVEHNIFNLLLILSGAVAGCAASIVGVFPY